MKNSEKLNSIVGKLLDQVNESLDKKETPDADTLEAVRCLADLTQSRFILDGQE